MLGPESDSSDSDSDSDSGDGNDGSNHFGSLRPALIYDTDSDEEVEYDLSTEVGREAKVRDGGGAAQHPQPFSTLSPPSPHRLVSPPIAGQGRPSQGEEEARQAL